CARAGPEGQTRAAGTMTAAIRAATLIGALAMVAMAGAGDAQVITKEYDDGGVYEGTFRNRRQHGQGVYTLPDGDRYGGDWVEGESGGQGRAELPNGSVYEGQFVNGRPEGKGRITYADGGSYEGDWIGGESTGEGQADYANG